MAATSPAKPAQCSEFMPSFAISQPPDAAPMAWPAYMADELSAIDAAARPGAMATSRACCAEFDEKQPSAHGIEINAARTRVVPSGQTNKLNAMAPMPSMMARDAPT